MRRRKNRRRRCCWCGRHKDSVIDEVGEDFYILTNIRKLQVCVFCINEFINRDLQKVCHGFKITKRVDYSLVTVDHFFKAAGAVAKIGTVVQLLIYRMHQGFSQADPDLVVCF